MHVGRQTVFEAPMSKFFQQQEDFFEKKEEEKSVENHVMTDIEADKQSLWFELQLNFYELTGTPHTNR